jgi:RHS repeat-associated protein
MPFGEEIYSGIGGRTENQKYTQNGVDNIRKRFTGYEKDTETGLDFAEARYYHNAHGRFTAVDPLLASGKSANPQTFNRYAYTMNNPVNLIDPSGMISESTGACGERCPNSGPMVDGSAFQGQDSSFDWNKQQAKQPSVPLSISDYSKILENLPDFSFTRKSLVISGEKGGNSIEHPKKRLIIIEEATLEIEAKRLPEIKTKQVEDENGNTKTTNIYTYQITDRLVDLFGNEIIDYSSQTFYYNDNGIATIKEPWADPLVTFTVEDDNTEIYDDRLNITIKSGEEETSVDYTVQTVSNTVTVPLDYNNKVKIRPRIVFVAIPEN